MKYIFQKELIDHEIYVVVYYGDVNIVNFEISAYSADEIVRICEPVLGDCRDKVESLYF